MQAALNRQSFMGRGHLPDLMAVYILVFMLMASGMDMV